MDTRPGPIDTVYVAVGKDFKENKKKLLWCFQNPQWKKFVILHIHQQAKVIPVGWRNVPASSIGHEKLSTYRYQEWDDTVIAINKYLELCDAEKVQRDELVNIVDCEIEKGVIDLIAQHGIQNLVMGAAADRKYSQKMKFPSSTKAIYVNLHALPSCRIYFVCKGNLIHVREPDSIQDGVAISVPSTPARIPNSPRPPMGTPPADILLRQQVASNQMPHQSSNVQNMNEDELYDQLMNRQKGVWEAMRQEQKKQAKEKEELTMLVKKHEITITELQQQCNEKSQLLARITELKRELGETVDKLEASEKEKKEIQAALLNAQQARVVELGASMSTISFTEFRREEVAEATNNYDKNKKIGEGGFGCVYKGQMRYTVVAIKVLDADSMQGTAQFNQEVNVLSRVRHPNLVTLIGACTESQTLVYEYLPNGSLEDRMQCKDGRPPLTWQDRTRIAAEILSAILFLHSHKIVHGDLKPANILLDANLGAKISDFGICRILQDLRTTIGINTELKGTFAYIDPEFLATGKLTTRSDLYAFGVIVLELLTGKPPLWIASKVQKELNDNHHDVQKIIDPTAKDWPHLDALKLVELGLSCCKPGATSALETWAVLEPMRARLGCAMYSSPLAVQWGQPPSYFFCPILKEIMQDPHVAADGFTYEKEAIRGWLDIGHNTSPMTNMRLENQKLIPNHALRSSIQEWLQQQASVRGPHS